MYYVRKEHIHGPAEDSADLAYDEAEFESYVRWVKTQEGLPSGGHVPHIYIDSAGVPTIGYGHTDADTINKLQFQGESLEGISEQEADRLLRLDLSKRYGINLLNASEPRISKELFSYYLCKELNMSKRDLKQLRTYRRVIKLEDIILPIVK